MQGHIPAGARWRKSSFSAGAENCVELAQGEAWVAARDGKNPDGPVLVMGREAYAAMLGAASEGHVDRA